MGKQVSYILAKTSNFIINMVIKFGNISFNYTINGVDEITKIW